MRRALRETNSGVAIACWSGHLTVLLLVLASPWCVLCWELLLTPEMGVLKDGFSGQKCRRTEFPEQDRGRWQYCAQFDRFKGGRWAKGNSCYTQLFLEPACNSIDASVITLFWRWPDRDAVGNSQSSHRCSHCSEGVTLTWVAGSSAHIFLCGLHCFNHANTLEFLMLAWCLLKSQPT